MNGKAYLVGAKSDRGGSDNLIVGEVTFQVGVIDLSGGGRNHFGSTEGRSGGCKCPLVFQDPPMVPFPFFVPL